MVTSGMLKFDRHFMFEIKNYAAVNKAHVSPFSDLLINAPRERALCISRSLRESGEKGPANLISTNDSFTRWGSMSRMEIVMNLWHRHIAGD